MTHESLCRIVREQQQNETQFCLKPEVDSEGFAQVCYLITYRNLEFDLLFFERNYNYKLFIEVGTNNFRIEVNDNVQKFSTTCFDEYRLVRYLPLEAELLVLYSIFSKTLRLSRNVDTDVYLADDDVYDAVVDAVAAVADAVVNVYDADDDVYDAVADVLDAVDAYKYTKTAFRSLIKFRKQLEDSEIDKN